MFRVDFAQARGRRLEKGDHRELSPIDVLAANSVYFGPALLAYLVGMVFTFTALAMTQMGQPALLYLVPCTVGTTVVIAYRRGHLRAMWKGRAEQEDDQGEHDDVDDHLDENNRTHGDIEMQPLATDDQDAFNEQDDDIVVDD